MANEHHKHEKDHGHHSHKSIPLSFLSGSKIKGPVEDCSAGQVTDFAKLDKSVSYNNLIIKAPVSFIILAYNDFLNLESGQIKPFFNSKFQFVRRSCFLNDINIRIAIQSFQI
ncbi:hypothetical protein A3860_34230 [Niastella vici]|uniref:Uncharacterized protein n=1 Tax=Niastella vici TaxID=1703345 RepID=A0A1V9FP80_9BACT|nr:hypothetical protein A3860_34230 [Niastella vici]